MISTGAVRVIVLRTAGTNCDEETAFAFERAGAVAERVHINRLVEDPRRLLAYHILAIPGGFSYGDDIASGKLLANEIRFRLDDVVRRFLDEGRLIIGICNGFQVLVKAGLLPGTPPGRVTTTLTLNDSGRFETRWVRLRVDTDRCAFVAPGDTLEMPVAHGEGKFVAPAPIVRALEKNRQVVFRYVGPDGRPGAGYPWNPNGSVADIAGICDPTGRILGLMPHPERHVLPVQHPRWTRGEARPEGDGARIFSNAVSYVRRRLL